MMINDDIESLNMIIGYSNDMINGKKDIEEYYDDILILLKTGLRISELCGLTARDLDFENHTINIDHQLLRNQEGYYIETPKTKCGIRKVPMSEEAEKALQRLLKRKTGKNRQKSYQDKNRQSATTGCQNT